MGRTASQDIKLLTKRRFRERRSEMLYSNVFRAVPAGEIDGLLLSLKIQGGERIPSSSGVYRCPPLPSRRKSVVEINHNERSTRRDGDCARTSLDS
ncbi:hypothetical protein FGB62_25g542 [Gracilaria domingensis]|nr:hypothetical protein FGB62_25g542 [Gracilaria domingensis]